MPHFILGKYTCGDTFKVFKIRFEFVWNLILRGIFALTIQFWCRKFVYRSSKCSFLYDLSRNATTLEEDWRWWFLYLLKVNQTRTHSQVYGLNSGSQPIASNIIMVLFIVTVNRLIQNVSVLMALILIPGTYAWPSTGREWNLKIG